jgi:hypothetical protein
MKLDDLLDLCNTGKGVWADSACNSGYLLIYQRIVLREHTASAAAVFV